MIQVIEVYPFDTTHRFVPGFVAPEPGSAKKSKKSKPLSVAEATETYKFHIDDVYTFSYTLSHEDVLQNYRQHSRCDVCDENVPIGTARQCDGCSPTNVGCVWPEGAFGRHFACFRGVLCPSCEKDARLSKKYWYCALCVQGPTTHNEVWGHRITEPLWLRGEGTKWMSSTPNRSDFILWNEEPADLYSRRSNDRLLAADNISHRLAASGVAEKRQQAAVMMTRELRALFQSGGQQQRILAIIHRLHDSHLLVDDHCTTALLLPRDVRTLQDRATGGIVLDEDVSSTVSNLCMAQLQQQSQVVEVSRSNIGEILQEMLLDPAIPNGGILLEDIHTEPRVYQDDTGTPLYGPEAYHGSTYSRLRQTTTERGFLLVFSVHSDGVNSFKHSRYPYSIMIENVPTYHKDANNELRILGMGATPNIRKPRGSNIQEKLNRVQKVIKYTLLSRVGAELLADAEEYAKTPRMFWIKGPDGSLSRHPCHLRLLTWKADMMEQNNLVGIATDSCTKCYGYSHSTRDGRGGAGTPNRPHLSVETRSYCGTAERRTPMNMAVRQAACMHVARSETLAAADLEGKRLGVRYLVQNSLARFSNLLPLEEGIYGTYGFDILHNAETGVFPKTALLADACFLTFFTPSDGFQTSEDVRDYVDACLIALGTRYDHPNFTRGYWEDANMGGMCGKEMTSLLQLLPFIIAGNVKLISKDNVRTTLLRLICNLTRLHAEIKTRQWYTKAELDNIDHRVKSIMSDSDTVMSYLEPFKLSTAKGTGHGGDIPKMHKFGGITESITSKGSCANTNTEAGERSMKTLKAVDPHVRTGHDIGDVPLHLRLAAIQEDICLHAKAATSSAPVHPGATPSFSVSTSAHRFLFGRGYPYLQLRKTLKTGVPGPVVPDDVMDAGISYAKNRLVLPQLRRGGEGEGADDNDFIDLHFYSECKSTGVSSEVAYNIYSAGHCAATSDGRFVQVLVPIIVSSSDYFNGANSVGMRSPPMCLVNVFVPARSQEALKYYPELPVLWLRRGALNLIPCSLLIARVHITALYGDRHDSASHRAAQGEFLLNDLGDPRYSGPSSRSVFQRCSQIGCHGTLLMPKVPGTSVPCGVCGVARSWF
jgi:hypothetical protein